MERRTATRSPQEVLVLCRERDVKSVELRFADLLGRTQRLTVPVSKLTDSAFEEGFAFDTSPLINWRANEDSDLLLVPIPHSAWIDPFAARETLVLTCGLLDPVTREEHPRDPRNVARRAESYLQKTGVAEAALVGPEVFFSIFEAVRFEQSDREAFYNLDSRPWPLGRAAGSDGSGLQFPSLPAPGGDVLCDMTQRLIDAGVDVDSHQQLSESQARVSLSSAPLLAAGEAMWTLKSLVKQAARKAGRTATFMPQPGSAIAGNGLHVHLSLWKSGEPLFAGTGFAGLNEIGLNALGGVLKHAPALAAFTNPTTNSYRRLHAATDIATRLGYSHSDRRAACRVPMLSPSPKSKRIELCFPDPSCNSYLAFAAILMAVIDGIQNKVHPGEPLDSDADSLESFPRMPTSLEAALDALERDCDFLLRGDVFSESLLASWIADKQRHEIQDLARHPHPYEFCLYYDA